MLQSLRFFLAFLIAPFAPEKLFALFRLQEDALGANFRIADNPLGIHGMIAGSLAVAISELVDTELLDAKLKRGSREAELFRSSGLPSHSSA